MNTQGEIKALSYLVPPKDYYWKWSADGEAIETMAGKTILFRKELESILDALSGGPFPCLGSIVLITLSVKGHLEETQEDLLPLRSVLMNGSSNIKATQELFDKLLNALEALRTLPNELKTDAARPKLLWSLFQNKEYASSIRDTTNLVQVFINKFHVEAIQTDLFSAATSVEGAKDVKTVLAALKDFSPARIKNIVETGLPDSKIASVQADFLSVLQNKISKVIGEEQQLPLLDQMDRDPKHTGLSSLTRQLIAAISLPNRSGYPDQQYSGGVSDITNRGQLDRLLLSELAQEDDVLIARLANNEALYTHKEPKAKTKILTRKVFIDTGIFLWGLPRVFSVAVALAFQKKSESCSQLDLLGLVNGEFESTTLDSIEALNQQLQILDASPSPWDALSKYLAVFPPAKDEELFIITSNESLSSTGRDKALKAAEDAVVYVSSVRRTGEFELYQTLGSSLKLQAELQFDIEDILNPRQKPSEKLIDGYPEILDKQPWPLVAPAEPRFSTCLYLGEKGTIGLSVDGRLMRWGKDLKGFAMQLAPLRIRTKHAWVHILEETAYILAADPIRDPKTKNNHSLTLYKCCLRSSYEPKVIALQTSEFPIIEVIFQKQTVIIQSNKQAAAINLNSGLTNARIDIASNYLLHQNRYIDPQKRSILCFYNGLSIDLIEQPMDEKQSYLGENGSRRYHSPDQRKKILALVGPGCSTIVNIRSVFFDESGTLFFRSKRDHAWKLVHDKEQGKRTFRFSKCGRSEKSPEEIKFNASEDLVFDKYRIKRLRLPNGNTIYLDYRGFFHFCFKEGSRPSFSILLIQEKATVAWSQESGLFGNLPLIGGAIIEENTKFQPALEAFVKA